MDYLPKAMQFDAGTGQYEDDGGDAMARSTGSSDSRGSRGSGQVRRRKITMADLKNLEYVSKKMGARSSLGRVERSISSSSSRRSLEQRLKAPWRSKSSSDDGSVGSAPHSVHSHYSSQADSLFTSAALRKSKRRERSDKDGDESSVVSEMNSSSSGHSSGRRKGQRRESDSESESRRSSSRSSTRSTSASVSVLSLVDIVQKDLEKKPSERHLGGIAQAAKLRSTRGTDTPFSGTKVVTAPKHGLSPKPSFSTGDLSHMRPSNLADIRSEVIARRASLSLANLDDGLPAPLRKIFSTRSILSGVSLPPPTIPLAFVKKQEKLKKKEKKERRRARSKSVPRDSGSSRSLDGSERSLPPETKSSERRGRDRSRSMNRSSGGSRSSEKSSEKLEQRGGSKSVHRGSGSSSRAGESSRSQRPVESKAPEQSERGRSSSVRRSGGGSKSTAKSGGKIPPGTTKTTGRIGRGRSRSAHRQSGDKPKEQRRKFELSAVGTVQDEVPEALLEATAPTRLRCRSKSVSARTAVGGALTAEHVDPTASSSQEGDQRPQATNVSSIGTANPAVEVTSPFEAAFEKSPTKTTPEELFQFPEATPTKAADPWAKDGIFDPKAPSNLPVEDKPKLPPTTGLDTGSGHSHRVQRSMSLQVASSDGFGAGNANPAGGFVSGQGQRSLLVHMGPGGSQYRSSETGSAQGRSIGSFHGIHRSNSISANAAVTNQAGALHGMAEARRASFSRSSSIPETFGDFDGSDAKSMGFGDYNTESRRGSGSDERSACAAPVTSSVDAFASKLQDAAKQEGSMRNISQRILKVDSQHNLGNESDSALVPARAQMGEDRTLQNANGTQPDFPSGFAAFPMRQANSQVPSPAQNAPQRDDASKLDAPLRVLNPLAQEFLTAVGILSNLAFIKKDTQAVAEALLNWRHKRSLPEWSLKVASVHVTRWKREVCEALLSKSQGTQIVTNNLYTRGAREMPAGAANVLAGKINGTKNADDATSVFTTPTVSSRGSSLGGDMSGLGGSQRNIDGFGQSSQSGQPPQGFGGQSRSQFRRQSFSASPPNVTQQGGGSFGFPSDQHGQQSQHFEVNQGPGQTQNRRPSLGPSQHSAGQLGGDGIGFPSSRLNAQSQGLRQPQSRRPSLGPSQHSARQLGGDGCGFPSNQSDPQSQNFGSQNQFRRPSMSSAQQGGDPFAVSQTGPQQGFGGSDMRRQSFHAAAPAPTYVGDPFGFPSHQPGPQSQSTRRPSTGAASQRRAASQGGDPFGLPSSQSGSSQQQFGGPQGPTRNSMRRQSLSAVQHSASDSFGLASNQQGPGQWCRPSLAG